MKRLSSSAWATRHHQPIHGRQLPVSANLRAGEVIAEFDNRFQLVAEAWEHAALVTFDGYRLLIEDHGGMLVKFDEGSRDFIVIASWLDVDLNRARKVRPSEEETRLFAAGVQHGKDVLWARIVQAQQDTELAELALIA